MFPRLEVEFGDLTTVLRWPRPTSPVPLADTFLQPPNSFGTEIHLGVKRWDSECKVCYVEFWRYIEPRA